MHGHFESENWEKYELNKKELSEVHFDPENSGLYLSIVRRRRA